MTTRPERQDGDGRIEALRWQADRHYTFGSDDIKYLLSVIDVASQLAPGAVLSAQAALDRQKNVRPDIEALAADLVAAGEVESAPAAVREALIRAIDFICASQFIGEGQARALRNEFNDKFVPLAIASLSTPVPSPDGAGGMRTALEEICAGPLNTGAIYRRIAQAALSPSATVVPDSAPLYAAPPVRGDREAIAECLCDSRFGKGAWQQKKDGAKTHNLTWPDPTALEFYFAADAILSLQPSAGEREAIEDIARQKTIPELIEDGNEVGDLEYAYNAMIARARRALSRSTTNTGTEAAVLHDGGGPPMSSFEEFRRVYEDMLRWKKAESDLSDAYLRLRAMIPGALDTPHAPTQHQVWAVTEEALKRALALPRPKCSPPEAT